MINLVNSRVNYFRKSLNMVISCKIYNDDAYVLDVNFNCTCVLDKFSTILVLYTCTRLWIVSQCVVILHMIEIWSTDFGGH